MPNIRTNFTVGGEKEYKAAVRSIDEGLRVLNSEMKLTESAFKTSAGSMEALAAKNDVLERKILSQREKVQTLREALQKSAETYGEADSRTMKWQISLNNAEAELNGMNGQLEENKKAMEEQEHASAEATTGLKGLGDVIGGVADKLGFRLPDSARQAVNALGEVDTTSIAIAGSFAAVVSAGIKVERKLADMTKVSAAYADELLTQSKTTGISTQQLQEYTYAAELLDVSIDTIRGSMTRLTKNMDDARDGTGAAADAFRKLDVQVIDTDGNLMSAKAVFDQVIDRLASIKNTTERDALAMSLFGKTAQELNPLILAGSKTMQSYAKEAEAAGYVLDDVALNKLAGVDDALQRLQKQQEATKNQLSAQFAPYLERFYGNVTNGVKTLGEAVKDSGIVEAFGMLLQTAGDIIAPADLLTNKTVPALTDALHPLAKVLAAISDAGNFIIGALTLRPSKMVQAMGFGYLTGQYEYYSNYQKVETDYRGRQQNRQTQANGYGEYYANGKTYASYDAYLMDVWKKSGDGSSFSVWKYQHGYNASGTQNWRGGLSWVGEGGAELVELPRGARVMTAQESRKAAAGDTYYITIEARTVREFEDIVRIAKSKRITQRMEG